MTDVDQDDRVDLVVFYIDHPEDNRGYYRIGWNMGREEPEEEWTVSAVMGGGSRAAM